MKKKLPKNIPDSSVRPMWENEGWIWLAIDLTPPDPSETPMGKMNEILGPLSALRIIGSSDDLRGKIEDVEKVIRGMKTIKLFDDRDWEKSVDALETLLKQLQYFYRRAQEAEAILSKNELHFDTNTGKVKFLSSKREYLNRLITTIYSDYVGDYGEPKDRIPMGNVRRAIKEVLAHFVPEIELDDGPRGNIANAIQNYRR